jgi:hypothetical protein
MPVRDYYHEVVCDALQKDDWTITHDPYRLKLARKKNLYVDFGAEQLIFTFDIDKKEVVKWMI